MTYRVVFTREAREQLEELFDYITGAADHETASRVVNDILDRAETLAAFPHRGTSRDDLQPGLRTIPWKRRATLAYVVEDQQVVVIEMFYGGLDVERLLRVE